MPGPYYVRSSDGNDADDGQSWGNAKALLFGAAAIDAAGDTIWVSQAHAESSASGTIACAGTPDNPTRILCGNDGAEPPTALAATGAVTTTTSTTLQFQGSCYVYGLVVTNGSGANTTSLTFCASNAPNWQRFDNCDLINGTTGSTSGFIIGSSAGNQEFNRCEWNNCRIKLGGTNNRIRIAATHLYWRGGSVISGTSTPTNSLFTNNANRHGDILVDGVDFSNFASTLIFFDAAVNVNVGEIANCKLPSGWPSGAGALSNGTATAGSRFKMSNCDTGSANYKLWVDDYCGAIRDEATIVRTGGASDGVTPIAFKMTTTSKALWPMSIMRSEPILVRQDTVGSPITVTVHFIHDTNVAAGQGAGTANAFQDDEVWLEVQSLDTASTPLGGFLTDAMGASSTFKFGSVLGTAADQASSSESWGGSLTTPVKQKLEVTVTPQVKGVLRVTVCMAKASKTIYYCPKPVIS